MLFTHPMASRWPVPLVQNPCNSHNLSFFLHCRLFHKPSGRSYHEEFNPPKEPMKDDVRPTLANLNFIECQEENWSKLLRLFFLLCSGNWWAFGKKVRWQCWNIEKTFGVLPHTDKSVNWLLPKTRSPPQDWCGKVSWWSLQDPFGHLQKS